MRHTTLVGATSGAAVSRTVAMDIGPIASVAAQPRTQTVEKPRCLTGPQTKAFGPLMKKVTI